MAAGPVTDADREAVRRLHGEGRPRNVIAREIGRSGSTVSKIAAGLGLSFDRAETTAVATAARSADLASRRVALAEKLHDDAERLREQLWAPCIIGQFGGKENDWNEVPRDRPPFADQRQIMGAVSVAVDKSMKLAPPDTGDSSEQVRSMLADLGAALHVAFGTEGTASDGG